MSIPYPERGGCRVTPFIEAAAMLPAFEEVVLGARSSVWLAFRVFDPATIFTPDRGTASVLCDKRQKFFNAAETKLLQLVVAQQEDELGWVWRQLLRLPLRKPRGTGLSDWGLSEWWTIVQANSIAKPEDRQGFIVPYQLGRARRYAHPFWFVPDDLV